MGGGRNQKVAPNARQAQMLAAARRGNVEAQIRLATAYADGDGVTQDYGKQPIGLARRRDAAMRARNSVSAFVTPTARGWRRITREAVEWFRRSAEQGNSGAQVSLGLCLQKALGAPSNQKEAVQWFRRAAESGDAAGQVSLASALQSGRGISKNEVEAADWFRKAAAQGQPEAEFNLGKCHQDGLGVAMDANAAFQCFRRAADKGLPQAEFELGLCLYHGHGTEADLVQAYTWVSLAAQRSVPAAVGVRDELKKQMSAAQIAEGDRRVAELAPHRPKIAAVDPEMNDELRSPNEELPE